MLEVSDRDQEGKVLITFRCSSGNGLFLRIISLVYPTKKIAAGKNLIAKFILVSLELPIQDVKELCSA